ncbi:MAG: class I adenylate-forming enzyme family protein, partial [Bdellovibrionota bacterium]
ADDSRPFLSYYSPGKKTAELTFAEFAEATRVWTARLDASGLVREDQPAVVILGNSIETFFAYSALLSLGAIVTPIDPSETVDYVARVASFAGASCAIVFADWNEKLSTTTLPRFCVSDESTAASTMSHPIFASNLDSKTSIFFTSGTTGDSKAVLQTIGSTLANAEGTKRAGHISPSDVLSSCLPLFHVNAFNFSFLLPLYVGCRIVYMSGFAPTFWRTLLDERVSVASLSPPVLRLLLKDSRPLAAPSSLRYFTSASSALHRADLEGIRDRFGVRVCQAYGLSETINFTLFTPPDLSDDEFRQVVTAGTLPPAGTPVWGQDVALLDERGHEVDADETPGEVAVRGWNVLTEYLGNRSATEAAFAGGWFHTGDVAYKKIVSGRAFYFLCGRIKETVKRSGTQIYLSEIDQAAREIGLENACAVGFRNVHTDEEVGLFVVRGQNEKRSREDLLAELSKRLPFAKVPKVIVEGDEIPRTAVGKVRRGDLKTAFDSYVETRFQRAHAKAQFQRD